MQGTFAFDNWQEYLAGKPLLSTAEYLLYTDAWLTGDAQTGLEPYRFFNMIPIQHLFEGKGFVCASLALRIARHAEFEEPDMSKTESSRYHGGGIADEIAALTSLLCGVRLRPGGQTRQFDVGGDPQGQPVAWDAREEPVLRIRYQQPVLPRATGQHSLEPLMRLNTFPRLAPQKAIVLVRCARLYQDALWLADSEPNLAWILLVSAVETAATYWKTSGDSALDRLKESHPELVAFLDKTGIVNLCTVIAEAFSASLGSTKKFVDFLIQFVPPAPEQRPAHWAQVSWAEDDLKTAFRQIYGYRSKALHEARPFPAPMYEAPRKLAEDWEAVQERPHFIASSSGGGTWVAKDVSMSLHTFEYIARNALVKWWTEA